jgi:hypothetical protein
MEGRGDVGAKDASKTSRGQPVDRSVGGLSPWVVAWEPWVAVVTSSVAPCGERGSDDVSPWNGRGDVSPDVPNQPVAAGGRPAGNRRLGFCLST